MPKLVRITTVPLSLMVLLKGQMKFMKENGFDVTMISSDGQEVPKLLEQEDCKHIPVVLTRKITPFQDLKSLIQLTRILKKIKPEIVHTHTPKAGLIGMWAAKFAGVPIRLHTIAGLPWVESTGTMRKILIFVEKLTAFAANAVFPNSFVQKGFMESLNIANGKMKVLGKGSSNGINTDHFSINDGIQQAATQLQSQAKLSSTGWAWIFVGRIVKDKGIAELLDAFTELSQRFPEDQLWMVGAPEPDLDPLEEKHQLKLNNHPQIKSWGFQQDIRPYLAAAKVLVFPSYREGFPNVPLQAGAMGCMLLLSDINGCNEIVENGMDGKLVPTKNSNLLLKAMMETRANPEETNKFARKIQQKIIENYNQKTLWQTLLKEYETRLKNV
jgi:glycosyltransferase involved in cell wall biosynthesis